MKLPEKFALAATSLTAAVSTSLLLLYAFNPPAPRCEPPEIKIRLHIDHAIEPSEPAEITPFMPDFPPVRNIRLRGAAP
jgi:hypothetical protein